LTDVGVVTVAIDALHEGILVDDHIAAADRPGLRMTFGAGDVGMATSKREMGFDVVVERGWGPVLRIVAVRAVGFVVPGYELVVVDVVVAGFASLRRACKARGVIGGGFVALRTGDSAMRAEKREFCFGVVEAGYVRPRF